MHGCIRTLIASSRYSIVSITHQPCVFIIWIFSYAQCMCVCCISTQEFAEKFDDLKDLLTEHVYNMSELHKKANNARGSAENGAVAPSGGADGDVPLPLRDPLSSVILQEIRARKEAARTAAAKALTEAQDSKRASDVTPSEVGTVPVAMAAGNAGIAEKAVDQGGMSILRQQQLEKTIKNILARLEKVSDSESSFSLNSCSMLTASRVFLVIVVAA